MSEPHSMPDKDFDWDRLLVRKFVIKTVHDNMNEADWHNIYTEYQRNFIDKGWDFEKFKYIAKYDGLWIPELETLSKLHKLSTFA